MSESAGDKNTSFCIVSLFSLEVGKLKKAGVCNSCGLCTNKTKICSLQHDNGVAFLRVRSTSTVNGTCFRFVFRSMAGTYKILKAHTLGSIFHHFTKSIQRKQQRRRAKGVPFGGYMSWTPACKKKKRNGMRVGGLKISHLTMSRVKARSVACNGSPTQIVVF